MFRRSLSTRKDAMTLAEMMIASSIVTLMAGLLFTAFTMIKHTFVASEYHATRQLEQARLLDYVSRDLRRAFSASQGTYQGFAGISMVVPDFYQPRPSGSPALRAGCDVDAYDVPYAPRLVGNTVIYGPSTATSQPTLTVWYYKNTTDNKVYRTTVRGGVTQAVPIVTDVQDFTLTYPSTDTRQTVEIKITFQSKYRFSMATDASVREGTAAYAETLLRNKR